MRGKVASTLPPVNGYPIQPSPLLPWQLEQLAANSGAPSPSGPATVSVTGVSDRAYMNTQTGRMLSVAIAQNGIFWRSFAAAMNGASGFGGGGATGCAG